MAALAASAFAISIFSLGRATARILSAFDKNFAEVARSPDDGFQGARQALSRDRWCRGSRLAGHDRADLHNHGPACGEPRSTPLIYGSAARTTSSWPPREAPRSTPAWYMNLSEEPEVTVQVRGDRFKARARTATAEEKPELWQMMAERWPAYDEYQRKTDAGHPRRRARARGVTRPGRRTGPRAGCTSSASAGPGMSGLALIARALGAQRHRLGPGRVDLHRAPARARDRAGDRPRRGERARPAPRSCTRPRSRPTTPSAGGRAGASCTAPSCWPRSPRCGAASRSPARTARRRRPRWSSTRCAAAGSTPAYVVGGELRDTGSNAGWGSGEWIVVEADESDRSLLQLRPGDRGAHQRRARPPLDLRLAARPRGDVARVHGRAPGSARSSGTAPSCARCARRARVAYDAADAALSPRGSRFRLARASRCRCRSRAPTTRSTPPGALTAAALAGRRPGRGPRRRWRTSAGARRRFELLGRTERGCPVYDDYAHHPTEVAAAIAAARTLAPGAAGRRVPAAPVLAHARARARVRVARWPAPTSPSCSTSTRRASAPRTSRASTGTWSPRPPPTPPAGGRSPGCPAFDDARRSCSATLRDGRPVPGDGRRRHRRARPVAARVSRDPPGRRSTLPADGRAARRRPARLPARAPDHDPHRRRGRAVRAARDARGARAAARLGGAEELEVGVVGSGSNLLVADAGVRGLVVKLDKELSTIELDGTRIRCGGGARLPAVSARAARAGLTGIEFGVNIPGTVGGAVRMNANAYGGELARVLEWVDVVSPPGPSAGPRTSSASPTAARTCAPGEIVARASFALSAAEQRRGQGDARRHARAAQGGAALRASRPSARPSRTPTTRAPRAAPPASCSRPPAAAGCGSAAPGSRPSTRTSSRTTATPPPPTWSR